MRFSGMLISSALLIPWLFSAQASVEADASCAGLEIVDHLNVRKRERVSFNELTEDRKALLVKAFRRLSDPMVSGGVSLADLSAVHGVEVDPDGTDNSYRAKLARDRKSNLREEFSVFWNQCHSKSAQEAIDIENPGSDKSVRGNATLFLMFHRAYLRALEQNLYEVLHEELDQHWPDFALPYWDWMVNPSLPCEFRRRDDENNCQSAGEFRDNKSNIAVRRYSHSEETSYEIWKKDSGDVLTTVAVDPRLSKVFFLQFEELFEHGWHSVIHSRIGDDMRLPQTAAWDPIFWFHHANVDRLWVQWVQSRIDTSLLPLSQMENERLGKLWNRQKYSFPVRIGDKIMCYRPSFDSLQSDSNNPMGYRYGGSKAEFPVGIATVPAQGVPTTSLVSTQVFKIIDNTRRDLVAVRRIRPEVDKKPKLLYTVKLEPKDTEGLGLSKQARGPGTTTNGAVTVKIENFREVGSNCDDVNNCQYQPGSYGVYLNLPKQQIKIGTDRPDLLSRYWVGPLDFFQTAHDHHSRSRGTERGFSQIFRLDDKLERLSSEELQELSVSVLPTANVKPGQPRLLIDAIEIRVDPVP